MEDAGNEKIKAYMWTVGEEKENVLFVLQNEDRTYESTITIWEY